jgi:hypothetical protein
MSSCGCRSRRCDWTSFLQIAFCQVRRQCPPAHYSYFNSTSSNILSGRNSCFIFFCGWRRVSADYGYPSLSEVMRTVNAELIAAEEKAVRDALAASSVSASSSSHQSPLADSSHLPPPPPPPEPSLAASASSAARAVAPAGAAAPQASPSSTAPTAAAEVDDSVKSFSLNDHLDIRDPHGKWLQAMVRGIPEIFHKYFCLGAFSVVIPLFLICPMRRVHVFRNFFFATPSISV